MTTTDVISAVADYDRSGRWPVTADGWQVRYLGHSLFPGGPGACEVVSPLGRFYFGLGFDAKCGDVAQQVAVVTSLGRATLKTTNRNLLTTAAATASARQHITDYLLQYPTLFHYLPLRAVEYRADDGKIVDIF